MRYKSFDQFVSEMDRAEEIEKEIVDLGKPEEHEEEEAEKVQANESEEKPEAAEKAEEIVEKAVSEMLTECYEKVTNEAKAWESDAHDDHTIESYMCENAALMRKLYHTPLLGIKGARKFLGCPAIIPLVSGDMFRIW